MQARIILSLACLLGTIYANAVLAATIAVQPDGSGDFPTIQDAIDAASEGDEIVLGDGIYRGEGNRDITFEGKNLVVRSASDDPTTCILDVEGSSGSPHRGFLFYRGEGPDALLSGVTVTNGFAPPDPPSIPHGGAIGTHGGAVWCLFASPTIENCHFLDSEATWAGGVHLTESSSLMRNCTVAGNYGSRNTGGVGAFRSAPTLEYLTVYNNSTAGRGAGVSANQSTVVWRNCTIVDNTGINAVWIINDAVASLSNTIIAFNSFRAIECPGGGSAVLECCDIYGNSTDYADCFEGQLGQNGNISADPLFCAPQIRDYGLAADSPCAPATEPNPECPLIGALGISCGPIPIGACCSYPGDCSVTTEYECLERGGAWFGAASVCDPNPCPQFGACCFGEICIVLEETECTTNGGRYKGRGTVCSPDQCQIIGACCFMAVCIVLDEDDCLANNGAFAGDETVCDPNPCIPSNLPTPADLQARLFLGLPKPNPASDRVSLTLILGKGTRVTAQVYSVSGQLIEKITDRDYGPGAYELHWEPGQADQDVRAGVYYFVVQAGADRLKRRVVVAD